jgi:hypothetical protein
MFIAVADMRVNLLPTTSHMMRAGYTAAVCITGRPLSLSIQGCQPLFALALVYFGLIRHISHGMPIGLAVFIHLYHIAASVWINGFL